MDYIVLSNLARPIDLKKDFLPCVEFTVKSFFKNIIYRSYDCGIIESTGSQEEKISMSNIAGTVIIDANTANISSYKYFVAVADGLIQVYQYSSWIIFWFAFYMFFIEMGVNIRCLVKKKETHIAQWLIKLGIMLTIFANLAVVTINYFDAYNGEGARVSYTVGIIPLWQVFVCLTICTLYKYIKNRPKRAALKKKVAKL